MSSDTTWTEMGQPTPRTEPTRYNEHLWNIRESRSLAEPANHHPQLAFIESRQSRRTFGELEANVLHELFWHVAACRRSTDSPMGFPLESRGAPSAGAIHPIHVLVGDPRSRSVERYDSLSHSLQLLQQQLSEDIIAACTELVPPQSGKLLLFAAEPGKTAAKYDGSASLVWRDAGVLQGSLALVSEALGLNFCLLGMTGEPWISQLSNEGKLRGVGIALVGSRL